MQSYYVYLYRDPTHAHEVFYVGKGSGKRARNHLHGHMSSSAAMQGRLATMRNRGVEPEIEIVSAIDEEHAFFLEQCLIDVLGRKSEGTGALLNISAGGRSGALGARRSAATRARMSAAQQGRTRAPMTEETKRRMSESHRGTRGNNLGRTFGPRPRISCLACRRDTSDNAIGRHGMGLCVGKEN